MPDTQRYSQGRHVVSVLSQHYGALHSGEAGVACQHEGCNKTITIRYSNLTDTTDEEVAMDLRKKGWTGLVEGPWYCPKHGRDPLAEEPTDA